MPLLNCSSNTGFPTRISTITPRRTIRAVTTVPGPQASQSTSSTSFAHFCNSSRSVRNLSPVTAAPEDMFLLCSFVILVYRANIGSSLPASYDQRQTGGLNVQIDVKDVQVLALLDDELLDDYTDYDYVIDYGDITIKPITKPTTSSTSSVEPWHTWPTNPPTSSTTEKNVDVVVSTSAMNSSINSESIENIKINSTTERIEVSTGKIEEGSTGSNVTEKSAMTDDDPSKEKDIVKTNENAIPVLKSTISKASSVREQSSKKHCRFGYSPNGKGRCRRLIRQRLSFMPLALKLAPKLLSEMKLKQ